MKYMFAVLIALVAALSLSACLPAGQGSTAQPTPDTVLIARISHKVAALYGESNPQVVKVNQTTSEGTPSQPLDIVFLSGNFHQSTQRASGLSFSMLANGKEVWAVRAFDAQNHTMWITDQVSV